MNTAYGDHIGGCTPIVNALRVDAIIDSGQPYSGRAYRDCMAAAATRRVPVITAHAGMHWRSDDGVTLDILAPSPPLLADTGDDVNENSIVLKLAYRDFSALFMGDAGQSSEARLIASGVDLRAQVGLCSIKFLSGPIKLISEWSQPIIYRANPPLMQSFRQSVLVRALPPCSAKRSG